MSHDAVQDVLNRALADPDFRRSLLLSPDEVLVGFDLTEDEAAALRSIRSDEGEAEAVGLDERRSKAPSWFAWRD